MEVKIEPENDLKYNLHQEGKLELEEPRVKEKTALGRLGKEVNVLNMEELRLGRHVKKDEEPRVKKKTALGRLGKEVNVLNMEELRLGRHVKIEPFMNARFILIRCQAHNKHKAMSSKVAPEPTKMKLRTLKIFTVVGAGLVIGDLLGKFFVQTLKLLTNIEEFVHSHD
ncbi:unnamed protein product [Timema podura]|uniref:Uncharacterized protein n=1 Tax=Timema podura TaxID=61482 RepID=A0ABN7NH23_TIMPD|nr:unnamed protein product [Timema podura]